VAEQVALERAANRMELVARWADDLAHEIKNPLHAMVINLELVKRWAGGQDPDPIIQRAEIVETELHRVHRLMDSLLRLLRPWPDRPSADPDQIFELLGPVVAARARIRNVEYAHEAGSAPVALPPADLALSVINLIDNALDAMPEGGRMVTRCEAGPESVRIEVVDTGSGVPADLSDRAALPGVSGRAGRSGLGLAVTDRLVRQAGGTLALASAGDGPGTIATLVLPRPRSA
jgi:signal transduction histidine kinase